MMWYLGIIGGVRGLLRKKGNGRMLGWEGEEGEEEGMVREGGDGWEWGKMERKFKEFGKEGGKIGFGLSRDGMNGFGEMRRGDRSWGVRMCM